MKICSKTNAAARFAGSTCFASVLSRNTPMKVTKGGTNRAVEKYGIASVIHKHTISNRRERHLPAATLLGVIDGSAKDSEKTTTDIIKP